MLKQQLQILGFDPEITLQQLDDNLTLSYQDGVLSLCRQGNLERCFAINFNDPKFTYRLQRASHEQVVKACRIKKQKHLRIMDATCGLGRDAMLLQQAGFSVTAYERHPILAALLADALHRLPETMTGFKLQAAAAETGFNHTDYDVIYLDPMFPSTAKSARVKKDMHILQKLHHLASDNGLALFYAAWQADCQRIVIKRPQKADTITSQKPTFQINGKTCRFDVYQRA
ncbi:class I SAM-dependent methyltransferase [Marinicella gelatinilytica]|uniref:class I SAM-dependent methyltransferase n=1 Tax=Marinicella gelatinilytica TaxID=2996017 RepID=UPI002260D941|nr:class I SAM-dependent methyltransferase [Marinicella gelatinilytica]MCX7545853.1 class I SAM-dependent methyltransferase [Marinicella gelatinilytica]